MGVPGLGPRRTQTDRFRFVECDCERTDLLPTIRRAFMHLHLLLVLALLTMLLSVTVPAWAVKPTPGVLVVVVSVSVLVAKPGMV